MKVLHINCNYLGTALHQCMVEHLDRHGVDNTVFVPTFDLDNSVIAPNKNVLACKCFHKWDRLLFYYKQRKIQNALEGSLRIGDFDLLHAYTLFTDGNSAYELWKKYGIDYVVAVRSTDVNSFFKWRPHLIKRGLRIMMHAKAVFFLSKSYKQQVLKKYVPRSYQNLIDNKSYVIPNGIDDFWIQNLNTENNRTIHDPLRLIYVGTLIARKNIPKIQEAMNILRKKGQASSLLVVGKMINKSVFRQVCKDLNTTYSPPKQKNALVDIYRNGDIFIMPSFAETFGLVYAEAISQGLPVVYSAGEGFDKQFDEGEVGFHADPHSAESVADAIEKIALNYSEITKDISQKAMKYNWDRICAQYCEIYQSILLKR